MKSFVTNRVTPQAKIVNTNNRFGNNGIKKMQGSTVILYDTLPLTGSELRFFEGAQSRNFPETNCNDIGNRLAVGSSMAIESINLSIVTKDADGKVIAITPLSNATDVGILQSEIKITVANTEVVKKIPVLEWIPDFNVMADNQLCATYEFSTQVVLPPLLEFIVSCRLGDYTAVENTSLRLTIAGAGAIIAPQRTF